MHLLYTVEIRIVFFREFIHMFRTFLHRIRHPFWMFLFFQCHDLEMCIIQRTAFAINGHPACSIPSEQWNHEAIKMPRAQARINSSSFSSTTATAMFDYKDEKHIYKDALDLKHPESTPVAKEHNLKQSKSRLHRLHMWSDAKCNNIHSCHQYDFWNCRGCSRLHLGRLDWK